MTTVLLIVITPLAYKLLTTYTNMNKQTILIGFTCIFIAALFGFFYGQNVERSRDYERYKDFHCEQCEYRDNLAPSSTCL